VTGLARGSFIIEQESILPANPPLEAGSLLPTMSPCAIARACKCAQPLTDSVKSSGGRRLSRLSCETHRSALWFWQPAFTPVNLRGSCNDEPRCTLPSAPCRWNAVMESNPVISDPPSSSSEKNLSSFDAVTGNRYGYVELKQIGLQNRIGIHLLPECFYRQVSCYRSGTSHNRL
jgi:hypothetical protein